MDLRKIHKDERKTNPYQSSGMTDMNPQNRLLFLRDGNGKKIKDNDL